MEQMIQGLMFNAAIFAAAATILGVIVAFILLYLILERKKKSLIAVFVLFLGGVGWFYHSMYQKPPVFPDMPKTVMTESIQPYQPPIKGHIPLPKPFPHAKKGAKLKAQPLPLCPPR